LFTVRVALASESVIDPAALTAMFDHARHPQRAQVAGHGRLCQPKGLLKVTDAELALRKEGDDSKPCLVSQGLEEPRERPRVDR
jgi:hypothetical protein